MNYLQLSHVPTVVLINVNIYTFNLDFFLIGSFCLNYERIVPSGQKPSIIRVVPSPPVLTDLYREKKQF